jgi:hypothetical protein
MKHIIILTVALFLTACSSKTTLEKKKQEFINANVTQQQNWLMSLVDTSAKKTRDDASNNWVKYARYLRTGKHDVEKRVPYTTQEFSCIDPKTKRRSNNTRPFGTDCVTIQLNHTRTEAVQENINSQEIKVYQDRVSSNKFILDTETTFTALTKEYLLSVHKKSPSAAFDEIILYNRGVLQYWPYVLRNHCKIAKTDLCIKAAQLL